MTGLACVTGRFQPVHHQHVDLFEIAARPGDHLVVAVTNPDTGALRADPASPHRHLGSANPFSYYQRTRMLQAALAAAGLADRATIVPFDLTRPEHWHEYVPRHARQVVRAYGDWERRKADLFAAAGYRVTLLDGDAGGKLSATDIRARLATGTGWEQLVPDAVVPLLRAFLIRPGPVPTEPTSAEAAL